MTTYIICYDLAKPDGDYAGLTKAIRDYSAYCKLQKSVWAIVSDEKASVIRDNLKKYIDENDEIFIAKVSAPAAWTSTHGKEVSDWLKKFL